MSTDFTQAMETSRPLGVHAHEGCGYVGGISTWGPPTGHDGYRQRNIDWTRNKLVELKEDRRNASRRGNAREVEVIDGWLDTYRRSLGDVS